MPHLLESDPWVVRCLTLGELALGAAWRMGFDALARWTPWSRPFRVRLSPMSEEWCLARTADDDKRGEA